ncbi:hypothetical protein [Streptomyces sp. NPDC050428]
MVSLGTATIDRSEVDGSTARTVAKTCRANLTAEELLFHRSRT